MVLLHLSKSTKSSRWEQGRSPGETIMVGQYTVRQVGATRGAPEYCSSGVDRSTVKEARSPVGRQPQCMGCLPSKTAGKSGSGAGKGVRPPQWKSDGPLTSTELQRQREEFWDTAPAYGGDRGAYIPLRLET